MPEINHFAISAIIGSEIAGRANIGHGQIAALGGGQKYLSLLDDSRGRISQDLASRQQADSATIRKAFLAIRDADGDKKSADLYIADPLRNARFIAKCRELGLQESEYILNKGLLNARKSSCLKGLKSERTVFHYEDYAFASEFAATEIKYETGATIDDVICHPVLADRFDATARALAAGYSSLEYRWALLSIRKAGRRAEWKAEYKMPSMQGGFRLLKDPLEMLPASRGIYLLFESEKPLYARSTSELRHGIDLHRRPQAIAALANPFWKPNLNNFTVSYATISDKQMLRPIEKRVVEEWRPIFNIPRAAA